MPVNIAKKFYLKADVKFGVHKAGGPVGNGTSLQLWDMLSYAGNKADGTWIMKPYGPDHTCVTIHPAGNEDYCWHKTYDDTEAGNPVHLWQFTDPKDGTTHTKQNGRWFLHPDGSIRCYTDRAKAIHIAGSAHENGTGLHLWNVNEKPEDGQWIASVDPLYRAEDIKSKLEELQLPDQDTYSYFTPTDEVYTPMLDFIVSEIYNNSGLRNRRYRSVSFDCDDFAVVMKAEVAKYVYDNPAEFPPNAAPVFGIMFGRTTTQVHAYNFYVDVTGNVVLFEPQNGTSGKASNLQQYTPYFAVF